MSSKYYNLDTDTLLGGNSASDFIISSQKALKTYIDNHSGSSSLSSLSDVSISSATSGDVLSYNGSNWVNDTKTKVTFRVWS